MTFIGLVLFFSGATMVFRNRGNLAPIASFINSQNYKKISNLIPAFQAMSLEMWEKHKKTSVWGLLAAAGFILIVIF